jgi:hypothetical protein
MKSLKFIMALCLLISLSGCQQLMEPEYSSTNTLTSINCVVVMEEKVTAMGKPDDVKQIFSGSISDNGIVTFSGIGSLTPEQKVRARFEAIFPLTATIVEKDGAGNVIGSTIGGQRSISKKTYYFYVVAANGTERKYTLSFN